MTPANSCPGTCGSRMSGSLPIHPCQSLRQMPQALSARTTPSSLQTGSGTFSMATGCRNWLYKAALMVPCDYTAATVEGSGSKRKSFFERGADQADSEIFQILLFVFFFVWIVCFVVGLFKKLTTKHAKKNVSKKILGPFRSVLIRPIRVQKIPRESNLLHFFTGRREKLSTNPRRPASKYTKAKAGLLRLHEVHNVIKK
jgi:hypothetical protein